MIPWSRDWTLILRLADRLDHEREDHRRRGREAGRRADSDDRILKSF